MAALRAQQKQREEASSSSSASRARGVSEDWKGRGSKSLSPSNVDAVVAGAPREMEVGEGAPLQLPAWMVNKGAAGGARALRSPNGMLRTRTAQGRLGMSPPGLSRSREGAGAGAEAGTHRPLPLSLNRPLVLPDRSKPSPELSAGVGLSSSVAAAAASMLPRDSENSDDAEDGGGDSAAAVVVVVAARQRSSGAALASTAVGMPAAEAEDATGVGNEVHRLVVDGDEDCGGREKEAAAAMAAAEAPRVAETDSEVESAEEGESLVSGGGKVEE